MQLHSNHGVTRSTDGFIVITVLWILAAVAAVATTYCLYVTSSAANARIGEQRVQAEALAEAALELIVYQRSDVRPQLTSGIFSFRLANANVTVRFISESARIDLNAAPKALLSGLFSRLGANQAQANQYADCIVGWRTRSASATDTAEHTLDKATGPLCSPRAGALAHIEELWSMQGLPAAIIEHALPFVTIFSGSPGVNAFDAPAQVIAAVPGIPSTRINRFLEMRSAEQPDWQAMLELLGANQTLVTIGGSETIRVNIAVAFDRGMQKSFEAVILPSPNGHYRTLSWSDDIDAAASPTPTVRSKL